MPRIYQEGTGLVRFSQAGKVPEKNESVPREVVSLPFVSQRNLFIDVSQNK